MTLPNFLIIGAQKAGTTWLAKNLCRHPDVYIHPSEIHYFDSDSNYDQGREWYERHFEAAGEARAVGEKTPEYLWVHRETTRLVAPNVHARVHRLLPDARLVVVLRNPVERAISALLHLYRRRKIPPIYSMDAYLEGPRRPLIAPHGVLAKGFYYDQIQAYRKYYSDEQMLILVFREDVVEDPRAGLRKVCSFLEIDPTFPFAGCDKKVHESRASRLGLLMDYYLPFLRPLRARVDRHLPDDPPRPSPSVVETLYDVYRESNEKLFELLDRRIESWQNP